MDMNQVLAAELNVKPWQVEAAVKLIDEGNTIPFISRYRKEATGSLNDEILRNLYDRLMYLRSLNDRKAVVLASIEEQGKLTAELKKSIEVAVEHSSHHISVGEQDRCRSVPRPIICENLLSRLKKLIICSSFLLN